MASPPSPPPLSRATAGRWLGGVCAGIARTTGAPVASVRAGFALAALLGGVGVLAYVACWLIVPAEGEHADGATGSRAIVSLVLAAAGALGLVTLGVGAAAATVFGFGWVVALAAGAVLVAALSSWRRLGPAWALLPVAALVLPSVALAAGGVRVAAQSGSLHFAPASAADLPHGGFRSGLGTMVVDLRHTTLPASGVVPLHIDAGLRRTIVALPHDRCVAVDVDYDVRTFAADAAQALLGLGTTTSQISVFGDTRRSHQGRTSTRADDDPARGPVLAIDFDSAGGSLYVRDYPDAIDPDEQPDWPGYLAVYDTSGTSGTSTTGLAEPRPDTTGMPAKAARELLREWRVRAAQERRSNARVKQLMPGPCHPATEATR